MTETQVRAAIMARVQQLQTEWTGAVLVVEPENRTIVDQATQAAPYVKVWIDFLAADQLDMADNPIVKQWGQIHLQAVVKSGAGSVAGAALRDFIRPYFNLKNLGGVHCMAAEIHKSVEIKGWDHMPVLINFYYTEISA